MGPRDSKTSRRCSATLGNLLGVLPGAKMISNILLSAISDERSALISRCGKCAGKPCVRFWEYVGRFCNRRSFLMDGSMSSVMNANSGWTEPTPDMDGRLSAARPQAPLDCGRCAQSADRVFRRGVVQRPVTVGSHQLSHSRSSYRYVARPRSAPSWPAFPLPRSSPVVRSQQACR